MARPAPLLTALALLAISAVATLLVIRDHPPAPEPLELVDPWADEDPPEAMDASDAWDAEGARDAEALLEREALEAETLVPTPEAGVALVLDEAGRPVADAEVFCAEVREIRPRRDGQRIPQNVMADLTIEHGTRRRTGPDGRAPLPPIASIALVVARTSTSFGIATADPRRVAREEVRVVLARDETLTLRVRDAAGSPCADVPVAAWQGRRFGQAARLFEGRTDEHGLARAAHFQLLRRPNRNRRQPERFAAAVRLPLSPPAAVTFDGAPCPTEPIDLTLPATGSVAVVALDPRNAPLLAGMDVRLVPVHTKAALADLQEIPLDSQFDRLELTKPAGLTAAVFERVGLGLTLRAQLHIDREVQWTGPEEAGPIAPDQRVTLRVPAPDWLALVRGRLLDGAGEPIARARVRLLVEGAGRRVEMEDVDTTTEARFELALKIDPPDAPPYVLEAALLRERAASGTRLPLADLGPGACLDVGDVVLTELSRIAHGLVVDDRGVPVRGAQVVLQRWRLVGGDAPRETWSNDQLVRTRTDREGRFELIGDPPPGRLRLRVTRRWHVAATSRELARGDEVQLELVRTGTVHGAVRLPGWLPRTAVSAELRPADSEGRTHRVALAPRSGVAQLRIQGVEPGSWHFVVLLANHPEPLLRIPAITVAPGDNRDPRLADIDLGNAVHRYDISVRDAYGRTRGDVRGVALARVWHADGRADWSAFRIANGRIRIVATQPSLELWVFVAGHLPIHRVFVSGDSEVVPQALHPVEVSLPGLRALVGPERRVRISLVHVEDNGLPSGIRGVDPYSGSGFSLPRAWLGKSGGAWLPENGETVRVPLMRNGRYEVVVRIHEPGVRGPESCVVGTVDVVLDGPTMESHRVPIEEPARIRAALAELAERRR